MTTFAWRAKGLPWDTFDARDWSVAATSGTAGLPVGPVTQQAFVGTGGNNTINGTNNADTFDMSQGGNDTVNAKGGDDQISFGATLTAADKVDGGLGNDTLNLNGNYAAGVTFNATTLLNVENILVADGFTYKLTSADVTVAAAALLTVNGSGLTAGHGLIFDGSAELDGAFNLMGGAGDDALTGGAGNDTINTGSAGDDTVVAGLGNDTINLGAGLTATDSINGGDGYNSLNLAGDYSAGVTFSATTVVGVDEINFINGFTYNLTTDDATVAAGEGLAINGNVLSAGNSLMFDGSAETDGTFWVAGGGGDDVITGGAQGDALQGWAGGNDTMDAGGGDDGIDFGSQFNSGDSVDGGTGVDTLYIGGSVYASGLTITSAMMQNVEQLFLAGVYSYDIVLDDSVIAAGQDLFINGHDLVAGSSLTLDASDETDGTVSVVGGAGNDTIILGAGDDFVDLSTGGRDIAQGEAGDDGFYMGATFNVRDRIDGGTNTGVGDTVQLNGDYSAGLTLRANTIKNVETLFFIHGNNYSVVLNDGNVAAGGIMSVVAQSSFPAPNWVHIDGSAETDGDLLLSGGAGDDILIGGGGNDLFRTRGGNDTLDGGGGFDRATFFSSPVGVTIDLTLSGPQNTQWGNVSFSNIEDLSGSLYDDTLTGNATSNFFLINGGNDTVNGGGGNDIISSVGGLDGHGVLATNIQINGGSGIDLLSFYDNLYVANATFSLAVVGAQVTGFGTVTATGIENLQGSLQDDTLTGDAGANKLYGVEGNDTLNGGAGSDSLYGDDGFFAYDGNGTDGPRHQLTGDVAGNDILSGGSGNDVLDGGGLADQLNGGTGRNIFVYGDASESVGTADGGPPGSGFDIITGFDAALDTLDLWTQVSTVDAKVANGQLRTAFFDTDMAAKITAAKLGGDHAILFTPSTGDYVGKTFLIVDANSTAGYQAGDMVIELNGMLHATSFSADNFISI